MKSDFLTYIQATFHFDSDEMKEFEESLSKPLKKSFRINTNKISVEEFSVKVKKKWWQLTATKYGKNMFYIDRTEDLERALWHTPEHIAGYFYIQEVAASSSPFYLSSDIIDTHEYKILDMSASPGGKTTQLAEYFPNALIIANEIDKSRLKQLSENIDRMGASNVLITNYDGKNFKNYEEFFDKILLDAPCSGEWTAFKTDDALKWWNEKNIENIARLQKQLLESALISLKVWGEMVYSTCTLNQMENEDVIKSAIEKYGSAVEIIPLDKVERRKEMPKNPNVSTWGENEIWWKNTTFFNSSFKRNWPHKSHTWGFFVAKIKKVSSFRVGPEGSSPIKQVRQNIEKLQNKQEKMIYDFFETRFWIQLWNGRFYKYGNDVSFSTAKMENMRERLFFYKTGIILWTLKGGIFEPSFFSGTLKKWSNHTLSIDSEEEEKLLRGYEIERDEEDGYFQIIYEDIPFGFCKIKGKKVRSILPKNMIKK